MSSSADPEELRLAYEPGDPKAWALSNEDWTHSTHDQGIVPLTDILNTYEGGEHMDADATTNAETTGEGDSKVSAVDTTLDLMIERASLPSLVSLYRQGKQSGLIQPSVQYAFDANGQKVRVKD